MERWRGLGWAGHLSKKFMHANFLQIHGNTGAIQRAYHNGNDDTITEPRPISCLSKFIIT